MKCDVTSSEVPSGGPAVQAPWMVFDTRRFQNTCVTVCVCVGGGQINTHVHPK